MPDIGAELVSLPKGRSWLLRPWLEGKCSYEALQDGRIGLADIALMNDALDAKAENEWRIAEWMKRNKPRS